MALLEPYSPIHFIWRAMKEKKANLEGKTRKSKNINVRHVCTFESEQRTVFQNPAAWKEENQITSSSVSSSPLWHPPFPPPPSMENRHIGQVLRQSSNHLSTQALWNSCMQGSTRTSSLSAPFSLDKHTQQTSPPKDPLELDPTRGEADRPAMTPSAAAPCSGAGSLILAGRPGVT